MDFKDLNRKTTADKLLCDKVFNITKNITYDGYQHELGPMVYRYFDKKRRVEQLKITLYLTKN